jgi:hypothetical protein
MEAVNNEVIKLLSQAIMSLKDTDNLDQDKYNYAVSLLEEAVDKLAS